jgi:hypothetical protein
MWVRPTQDITLADAFPDVNIYRLASKKLKEKYDRESLEYQYIKDYGYFNLCKYEQDKWRGSDHYQDDEILCRLSVVGVMYDDSCVYHANRDTFQIEDVMSEELSKNIHNRLGWCVKEGITFVHWKGAHENYSYTNKELQDEKSATYHRLYLRRGRPHHDYFGILWTREHVYNGSRLIWTGEEWAEHYFI